jgi:predicted enzyme related to lactoylglutathione lyase
MDPRERSISMTIIHGVVVDCADPARLASFWKAVLGWEYRANKPEEGWVSLQAPDGNGPALSFGTVPEGKTVKNRVHLDIRPTVAEGWEAERARLESLGATTLQYFEDAHYIMADPGGNEFCLLNPKWYEPEPESP